MKVIVISNYSLIREGIVSIISKDENMIIQFAGQTIREAMFTTKNNITDILLFDLHKGNVEELNVIGEIINSGLKVKIIVLDFYGDSEIFVKALKKGVQGYILGNSNEAEILYAINQVHKGKKYFDSYFIDHIINENSDLPNKLELLTSREREILMEISKGANNKKIAEKLFITENTVKKHISHIFQKLSVNNRTEIALYTNKYGTLNK